MPTTINLGGISALSITGITSPAVANGVASFTVSGGGGSGTVTSVGFTGGLVSVATATTTPAFTVAGTSGGIPYFSSASTWASSAALAAGGVVLGGGAGTTPATSTQLVFSGSTLTIGLATAGTGILALKGTTSGVISVKGLAAAGTYNFNLPTTAGSSGQVLTSAGGGAAAMTWANVGTTITSTIGRMAYYSGTTTIDGQVDVTTAAGAITLGSNGGNAGSLTIKSASTGSANLSFNDNGTGLQISSSAKVFGMLEITGNKVVTTQFDATSNTTLATAMQSEALTGSFTYRYRAVLHVTCGAAGGFKVSVASDGSTTATSIVQQTLIYNNSGSGTLQAASRQTALPTTVTQAAGATNLSYMVILEGALVVNAGGTIVLQFAQATSSGTPSSILVGSTFDVFLTNG